MVGLDKKAQGVLRAIARLYRERSTASGKPAAALGYLDPSDILVAAKIVGDSEGFRRLRDDEDLWPYWYSVFEELKRAGYADMGGAMGMHISMVRPTALGLQVAEVLERRWWQRVAATLVTDLRYIVVSVIASVITAVLTVMVMQALGFTR